MLDTVKSLFNLKVEANFFDVSLTCAPLFWRHINVAVERR